MALPYQYLCYVLSWGSPDPEFGFRFRVPEAGVGLDEASASESLCRLDFRVWYLAMGGGHTMGHDSEASDQTKGDDDDQRSIVREFYSSNVYN